MGQALDYIFMSILALVVPSPAYSEGHQSGKSPANDAEYQQVLAELKRTALDQEAVGRLADTDGFRVYARNPVLSPGNQGEWDAGAIGSMTVVIVDGVFHMYYEAWGGSEPNNAGVDYSTLQIGHALSFDGLHWQKDPANPVLPKGTVGSWDALGTWDPYVIYEDGVFKMWYGGGIDPACDWGYAESRDGRRFIKRGQISHLGNVEDDHVVHDAAIGRFIMYYWDRRHEPSGLFRAESIDERHFDFPNASPIQIEGEDPAQMYKFTQVLYEESAWFMMYANFLRLNCPNSTTRLAISSDGMHWKSVNKNLFEGHDAEVIKAGDRLYFGYFGPRGYFDQKDSDVRVALYSGTLRHLINTDE